MKAESTLSNAGLPACARLEPRHGRQGRPYGRASLGWAGLEARLAGVLAIALMFAAAAFSQAQPVEQAWRLLAAGKKAEAVRLLHEIIKANPRDADARLLLGSVLAE